MTENDIATIQKQIKHFKSTGQAEAGFDQVVFAIAKYYVAQKDIQTAEVYFQDALDINHVLHDHSPAGELGLKNSFSVALTAAGYAEQSGKLLAEVIEQFQDLYPEKKANLLALKINYLNAKMKQGMYDGMAEEFKTLFDFNKKYNTGATLHRALLEYYRKFLSNTNQYKKAYTVGKEHLASCKKELGDNHKLTASSNEALGDICYYGAIGGAEGAFFYKAALSYHCAEEHYNAVRINAITHALGRLYRDVLFDNKTALDYFLQVIEDYQAEGRKARFDYLDSLLSVASILIHDHEPKKAKAYLDVASKAIAKTDKPYLGSLAKLHYVYALCFMALNQKATAIPYAEKAVQLQIEKSGLDHFTAKKYIEYLSAIDASNNYLQNLEKTKNDNIAASSSSYQSFLAEELYSDAKKRSIRVFISSTFRDMMNEREYLMKKIFPQFRKMCHERGVDFTEVDLRWGITEEDALKGKVIEICLNEIDRSRPYFIGILGERYGWIPDHDEYTKYTQIFENYEWVKDDLAHELSITEMEIQYGVLRNPKMEDRAFFYLRDEKLTPKGDENKERLHSEPYNKLNQLKKYLRDQDQYPVSDFDSIEALGKMVLEDLVNKLLADFELRDFTEDEKERLAHISHLSSFLLGFIGQEAYLAKMDELVQSGQNKIVVTGEQGIGKTALVAKWLHHNIAKKKDTFYLFHFVEASSKGSEYRSILKRLLKEIKHITGTSLSVKENSGAPSKEFHAFLDTLSPGKKLVIVLDGADRMIHDNFLAKFHWLPHDIPNNVSILITTRNGDERNVLLDTGYYELEIDALEKEERYPFITDYLSGFGKSLNKKLVQQIVQNKLSASPLALRALLDELRIFGLHEELEAHLHRFLKAQNPLELFEEILVRIEEDYGMDKPEAIGEALSIIEVSRGGMHEKELMELTNIAQMQWSPIYTSLESYFTNNKGILQLSNDFLSQAIENKYLNPERKKALHQRLVSFFSKVESTSRKYAELGYHLFQSGDKEGLKDHITDLGIFNLYAHDKVNELLKYWQYLSATHSLIDAYQKAFLQAEKEDRLAPIERAKIALSLSQYVAQFRKQDAGFFFLNKAYEINKIHLGEDAPETIEVVNSLGHHFLNYQDYKKAKEYISVVVDWLEKHPKLVTLPKIGAYSVLAQIEIAKNKLETGEALLGKALLQTEKLTGKESLATVPIMSQLARLYKQQHKYEEALDMLLATLDINKRIAGVNNMATGINYLWLAELCIEVKLYEKAKDFSLEALSIFEQSLGEKSMNTMGALRLLGIAEYLLENYSEAATYLSRALSLAFELTEPQQGVVLKQEIADVLTQIGTIKNDEGLIELANKAYKEMGVNDNE